MMGGRSMNRWLSEAALDQFRAWLQSAPGTGTGRVPTDLGRQRGRKEGGESLPAGTNPGPKTGAHNEKSETIILGAGRHEPIPHLAALEPRIPSRVHDGGGKCSRDGFPRDRGHRDSLMAQL